MNQSSCAAVAVAALACLAALATGCATQPDSSASSSAQAADTSAGAAQLPSVQPPAITSGTAQEPPRRASLDAETPIARYTTVSTQPPDADANPMAVIAKVHFPRQVVTTVGDAVRYVLIRTGYQLVPAEALDPRVTAVFALRLPDNQRVLGPYRVDSMLSVLMGKPYQLVTDPTARTINYTAADASSRPEQPASPTAAKGAAKGSSPAAPTPVVSLAQTRPR